MESISRSTSFFRLTFKRMLLLLFTTIADTFSITVTLVLIFFFYFPLFISVFIVSLVLSSVADLVPRLFGHSDSEKKPGSGSLKSISYLNFLREDFNVKKFRLVIFCPFKL